MTDTPLEHQSIQAAGIWRYLGAGLLAGAAAVLLNNIIYLIMTALGGFPWDLLTAGSILVASLLPNLLAALAFFALARFTGRARLFLTLGVLVFVLVSVAPHLGIGPAAIPGAGSAAGRF